jgi:hypothetical protein
MANYRILVGINYAGKRAESGDIVTDLPGRSIGWLLEQGIVEKADGKTEAVKPNKREQESPIEGDETDANL